MTVFWQKVGIFFSVMVSWAAVSGITPFFPKIAVDRGMPEWSIGLIYAVCPLTSILTTVSLPRVQERFGRKTILLTGIFLLSISNFIIALVWLSEGFLAILESIFSRITAGIGCGFAVMSANATVTSNFTEDAAKMIALIEIFCGLGLIIGPTFASGLYGLFGYFYSCFVMGCFILVSIPVLFFILGEFRDYVVVEQGEKIGLGSLFFRHVRLI
jgi:MFS family permease